MTAPQCFTTPELTEDEITAIKAVSTGTADAYQQRLAFVTILKKLSRSYDQHFVPGAADQTTFLSGRAFVGQQMLKISQHSPYKNQEVETP